MNISGYEFENENQYYTFISLGKKDIPKVVYFQEVELNSYNLVLVDYDFDKDLFSDTIVSNNGDLSKVMKTVITIILDFLVNTPNSCVILRANSKVRNKSYIID